MRAHQKLQRGIQALLIGLACLLTPWTASTQASPSGVQVKKVLFQQVNATTRIVLEVNGSPTDLNVSDQPGKPMTVSFRGAATAKTLPINRKFSWPNLSGVYADQANGRIQIFIKRNITGTVNVSTEKNHVIVTIPNFYYRLNSQNEIASGVRYLRFSEKSAQGPVQINMLEVDPRNPAVDILPALASNRMGAKNNVSSMVLNHQAVAGINGSFFKPDVGIPLGVLIINQELISGPIYDRVALGITTTNELVMSRIHLGGEVILPDGRPIRIHNINQPRVQANTTVVYSSRWGSMAPKVPANGLQIQLRDNRVTAVSNTNPLPIPKDGVVISGPATPELQALAAQPPNRPVRLDLYTLPDWSGMKHAIGGGPWLVKKGQPFVDWSAQHFSSRSLGTREPRSAVGITADGKMLLVTVDGRQKNVSVGMTLYELAYLMRKLGAVDAMNLDGGSSTQMSIYGKTVNTPSAGNVGVSNSLLIRTTNGDNVAVQSPSGFSR
ncbi:MAG: hypothetical protein K0Q50_897 [Vampirovibrio sp.]|nr:hypothetical protein [Vampirovibrio sp.]